MEGQQKNIELTGQRVVTFRERGQNFIFHLKRITQDEWRKVFLGGCMETETEGESRIVTMDFNTATISLIERNLERVEGYKLRDGGGDITQVPNWKEKIRPGHKLLAGQLLQEVSLSETPGEVYFDSTHDEVVLDALWGTGAPGSMMKYQGLVHRFHPATPEHTKRFYRANSESRIVGGSRTGRTIFANRRTVLLDLYDELIAEVDGYAFNGQPLVGVDSIKREMDALHKVAAVASLFNTPEVEGAAAAA
jgi:hypothetical protein